MECLTWSSWQSFRKFLPKNINTEVFLEKSLRSDKMDCDRNYHSLPTFITSHQIYHYVQNSSVSPELLKSPCFPISNVFCCNFEDSWKTFPLFFELPGGKVGSKVYRHWGAGSPPTNQGKWKAKRKQQLHVLVMGSLETRSHGMGSSWAQFTSFGSGQEF